MDSSPRSQQSLPSAVSVPSPDAATAFPPSPSVEPSASSSSSWVTVVSTPSLLVAVSCATALLLLGCMLTILFLLSRLRRSEKTIASLQQQLSSLAAAAVSFSAVSAGSTQQQPYLQLDHAKFFHDTVSRGSRHCSIVLDTGTPDDTLVAHSHLAPHLPPSTIPPPNNQCSSYLDAHLSRRPPTMTSVLSFRPLGRHSVASSPPSVCATSITRCSPRQVAYVATGASDWPVLPPTPTTRSHPLYPPLGVGDAEVSAATHPNSPAEPYMYPSTAHQQDTISSPNASATPQNPHSSPHSMCGYSRSNAPPPPTHNPSMALGACTSLGPLAQVPAAQPLAPVPPTTAHALTTTSIATPAPRDATAPPQHATGSLLDRHPSVHSDTYAPSFWFQLPPADSSTDLPHAPAPAPAPASHAAPTDVASLSATLHLGSSAEHVFGMSGDKEAGRSGPGVDLSDVSGTDTHVFGGGGSRLGSAESGTDGSERDAFLSASRGDGDLVVDGSGGDVCAAVGQASVG
ncbi:hypothetical protein BCR44DRAFT_44302, partial [Catenaria anguillulae PL171]